MYFSKFFIAPALLGLAMADGHLAAENASATASVSATPIVDINTALPGASLAAGMVNTHVVQVGGPNGSLVFMPENVVAAVGDLIQFQFNPKNHSVVQSTFDQPCVPIQNIMPNKTDAFYSGFMPMNATAAAAGTKLTYTIRVMDTKPIWFYCSQGQHCQAGMVGAINAAATGNKTMEAFKVLAAGATENLSPGQAPGSVGNPAQSPAAGDGGAEQTGAAGGSETVAGGAPTGSSALDPAQQTTNAAGRVAQSFFGLAVTAVAAVLLL